MYSHGEFGCTVHFTVANLLLKGIGEVVFRDGLDDPISAHLEAVLE
jgi:hypothetical protein